MIAQTLALLVDAYRELNAKKLFWIVLGLSGLFVLAFAGVGIDHNGVSIFVWDIPNNVLNLDVLPSRAYFYKMMFLLLGFQVWLTWIATVLALVSTCGIIPDFASGGSIELTLSKPIGRIRLLLTKYLAATLFVVLQVTVFTLASFLVVGVRSGEWVWSFFLAIPLVTLFYSYLYSICAVVGLVTRSTIAALLITLLMWFVIFIIHSTEQTFLQFVEFNRQAASIIEGQLEADHAALETTEDEVQRAKLEAEIGEKEGDLAEAKRGLNRWNQLHAIGYAVKTILPKTKETMDLLGRYIISDDELTKQFAKSDEVSQMGGQQFHGVYVSNRVVSEEIQKTLRERSVLWIIGTSLLFEAGVLAVGCWHFSRKDY